MYFGLSGISRFCIHALQTCIRNLDILGRYRNHTLVARNDSDDEHDIINIYVRVSKVDVEIFSIDWWDNQNLSRGSVCVLGFKYVFFLSL